MMLALQGMALGIGFFILGWMLAAQRRARREQRYFSEAFSFFPVKTNSPPRPACWLAVRSVSPEAVRSALGVNRAAPCSWVEGLAGSHEFFISPRVHGWVIVTGLGLPSPSDDVDASFSFSHRLEPQARSRAVFLRGKILPSPRAGRGWTTAA